MEHVSGVRAAISIRLGQAPVRGVLAGGILLLLALAVSGLFLFPRAAATPAPSAVAGQAPVVSAFRPRPRRTPTPTPPPQPTPTPTAAPSPTTLPTGTAPVSGTVVSGTRTGEASRSGKADTHAAASSPDPLLGWGLGALAVSVLGMFVLLITRHTARAEHQALSAPPTQRPTRARLNQLYHLLSARQSPLPREGEMRTELLLKEDQDGELLPPGQEPQSSPLKPPHWLIEARLLKAETGEWPAADQQEQMEAEEESR